MVQHCGYYYRYGGGVVKYKEYLELFRVDNQGAFVNLIIPASNGEHELNLIGKLPSEFSIDEIIRMKKYSADMFEQVDKTTLGGK